MRLGARAARVLVWEERGRIYLVWRSAAHWTAIKQSLKETFPRHCELSYDAGRRRWSVPTTMRQRLEQWLSWTFTRDVVEWVEAEPVSFSQCARFSHDAITADSGTLGAAS